MANYLVEDDIRPRELFETYLSLAKSDAETMFVDIEWHDMNCPACGDPGSVAFSKFGFTYRECPLCLSLWVSPRPSRESFQAFYRDSASSRYWAEVFSPAVEEVRRLRLWKPKALEIAALMKAALPNLRNVIDIGGGSGVFVEEFGRLKNCNLLVVEPSSQAAARCKQRGVQVIEEFAENITRADLPGGATLFTSFELLEHVHNPQQWFSELSAIMSEGDLLLVTSLSSTGLDIRLLWETSDSISPPHHINFLNPKSIEVVSRKVGLVPVKIFTPGKLDVDIISRNLRQVGDLFWRSVFGSLTDEQKRQWQDFLCSVNLSSHMWALLRKL